MSSAARAPEEGIAIVGIGCRFPGGADGPAQFWDLLLRGVDAVREAPESRAGFNELFDPDPRKPGRLYSRWGGFLERVDMFDAAFFGMSPREASRVDPQHRLLLELVWEACEDAGIPPPGLAGSATSVFVGISTHDYGDLQTYPRYRNDIDLYTNSGTATSIAANRISFMYDLRGPSVAVDTACSSSLTAVHLAVESLRSGDCTLAIAGGVQMLLSPELTIGFCKASMLSRDGRCKAFDAAANGYVRGEGGGVVLLKPLGAALRDGDPVYAVIRATAVNQDGRTNGMTVPSCAAQQAMLERALAKAGVEPRDVQYVEAHGTGTPVGDPIEAQAIGSVMSRGRPEDAPCVVGSVKTNLGHLEAASGMAGLIKVALCLHHRRIAPSLHFERANENIDLQALRLRVPTAPEAWPPSDRAPLAGVNSFGFGGANAHVLLEAGPHIPAAAEPDRAPEAVRAELLVASARSEQALGALAQAYAEYVAGASAAPLADICHTAARRRAHHEHRLAIVAGSRAELAELLTAHARGERRLSTFCGRSAAGGAPRVAFVFSGMGPQWWGMGRQLLDEEPVFRRALERCDAALRECSDWRLLEELSADESASRVAAPEFAQVSNFAIQAALAELWASFGIVPHAVLGHSGGAMAAAYVAGVYDLADAVRLCFHRSRLQGRPANAGRMLAVGAPWSEVAALVEPSRAQVSLAAVNGPSAITLAGDGDALERIFAGLQQMQIFARFLPVTIAYHSPVMDGIRDEFLASVADLRGRPARLRLASDTTAAWLEGSECDAQYWWNAIRQPVLFADGVKLLIEEGVRTFVEIGPHPVLASSIVDCMKAHGAAGLALASLRRKEDERAAMLRSLGALYAAGCSPQWEAVQACRGRLAPLPGYAWQRERHWFEPAAGPDGWHEAPAQDAAAHPLLGSRLRSARPSWEGVVGADGSQYLKDHVVQGAPVFPGAAYVELALAAGAALDGREGTRLRDVELLRPLVLERERTAVQLALDAERRRFEIFASNGQAGEWVCHAKGSIEALDAPAPPALDLGELKARIADEVAPEAFYTRMAGRGLQYGPAFRGVRSLRARASEALGELCVPELADAERYVIHPALLDAAFQLLVAAAETDPQLASDTRLFLPSGIREASFRAPAGEALWGLARLRGAERARVTGDVLVLGEDGSVRGEVRGLEARLVEAGAGPDTLERWLYEYAWEPAPRKRSQAVLASGWQDYYRAVEARLNDLAAAYALAALDEPGRAPVPGGWRASLLGALLENLERAGLARREGESWVRSAAPAPDAAALARAIVDDFPAHRLDVELLERCGPALADVLAGRRDGRDILLSGDGLDFLETFYREAPASAYYNSLAADVVADLARASPQPLRILEVGAGTGGTTAHILPQLPAGTVARYVFSDVSGVFLERARAKFTAYPFLEAKALDLTRDPAAQGFEAGAFDLVVGANVLHATPRLEDSIRRLHELLAPGGMLLLLEITRRPYWLDLAFGLMEGWWKFEDRALRPRHPLLPGAAWKALLADCGLEQGEIVADRVAEGEPAQSVVLARKAAPAPAASAGARRAAHWLVFADRRGVGDRLAAALRERGRACTIVRADDASASRGDLAALPPDAEGVAYLWPIDAGQGEDFERAQALGCRGLLAILQRIVLPRGAERTTLALVTAGAQAASAAEAPDPWQAALWGLGRTVLREFPALRLRMVDLGAECAPQEVSALAEELLGDDPAGAEEEVALRGEERLAHRLRPLSLARIAACARAETPGPDEAWSAEVSATGSLDSVEFRRGERRAPGPHEVEIAIDASSLNFRDVVLATGIVPGLESDQSFGKKRIGSDFAGRVTRCGAAVTGLREGDEVFGMGPGTFASYVVTDAALVAPKPRALNPQQAAAAPVAFITAHYALERLARLAPGESVLVHAASGGVGLAALQIAAAAGARVFATAGSAAKRAYLESLGVEAVFDSRSLAFADGIRERTGGRGVDVVLNSLAGDALEHGISLLAPYGRFVELGKADIYQNRRVELSPFRRNLSFFAVDLDRMTLERPQLVGEMLREVAQRLDSGALAPLPCTAFAMAELAQAMRFMALAKHVGKVVLKNGAGVAVRPAVPEQPRIGADATYLVSGGLGGLGLELAGWLARRGAGAIALAGRSAPSPEAQAAIDALRAAGARVEAFAADVSREEDVARVLAAVREKMPPLRGVFHAAMVLEDTALADLPPQSLDAVMAPKLLGAWNLHRLTLDEPLDYFVAFSSITSLLGNPGQANYAAANAFLDAFAGYRRARGLPATTINWGVISGAGYVARHAAVADHLAKQGYGSFSAGEALEAMAELLRRDAGQVMVARIDWKRLNESSPQLTASRRIRHLVPAGAAAARSGAGSVRARIENEQPAARRTRLEQYLREQAAALLGTQASALEPERPINELGVDSLIATELTLVLQRDLGVEVAGSRLLGGANLRGLAVHLLELMRLDSASAPEAVAQPEPVAQAEPSPEPAPPPPSPAPVAADEVDYGALDYSRWSPPQALVRAVVRGGLSLFARIETSGFENIPAQGPCILAVNHLSMVDVPLLLGLLARRTVILANEKLRRSRLIDWFVSDMGQAIYVTPNEPDAASLERALLVLRAGGMLALAPEGTRSKSGALARARTGVAYLATSANVPVIPLAAWGQEKWRERKGLRRTPVRVRAGSPLGFPPGPASAPQLRQHADEIMLAIAELLPPDYRGVYANSAQDAR